MFHPNLQRVFDMFNITDSTFRSFMLHAFEAGVNASEGRSNQVAALFQPTMSDFAVEFWPDVDYSDNGEVTLTAQEVDTLKSLLRENVTNIQNSRSMLRGVETIWYEMSTPDTPEGTQAFKNLNRVRTMHKKLLNSEKRLNAIIRKLKYKQ